MTISSFAKVTVQFSQRQTSKNCLISRNPPKSSIDRSVILPFLAISSSPCILSSLSLFSNPIPCLAGYAKLAGSVRDRENTFLHLLMENVKKVAVILAGFAAFPVIGALTGNLLALSGTLNNHVTLKLCKGKHNSSDDLSSRGVVHNPHIQDVHRNALINELVYQLKTILSGTGNTVKFRHDQRVSRLDFSHQLVQFRAMQLRAGINIRKDFLRAVSFQKFRLGFKTVAVNRLSGGADTSVTVNHSGSPSLSRTLRTNSSDATSAPIG
nr:MAG TPA: hypothetical protein [Caudoviricetes sp.]